MLAMSNIVSFQVWGIQSIEELLAALSDQLFVFLGSEVTLIDWTRSRQCGRTLLITKLRDAQWFVSLRLSMLLLKCLSYMLDHPWMSMLPVFRCQSKTFCYLAHPLLDYQKTGPVYRLTCL